MVSVQDGVSTDKVQEPDRAADARAAQASRDNEDDDFNVIDTKQIAETLSGTTR